ncbi:MAG: hypothetical protein ACI959_000731, partial [Limisphaerales bacterium]
KELPIFALPVEMEFIGEDAQKFSTIVNDFITNFTA